MSKINEIKELIDSGSTSDAIRKLDNLLEIDPTNDYLYYLRGNAFRKESNWRKALDNYLEAIAINPESPATEARQMVMDILEFYNKDMYNH